jgi:V/A-type H+/Na+-transporting ATPase subunit D
MRLKRTKSELKVQRESLQRYRRFLPTLQLKKQQLQGEVRRVQHERETLQEGMDQLRRERQSWVGLFAEGPCLSDFLVLRRLETGTQHIAGVDVPVLLSLDIEERMPDRFSLPVWVDDGLRALRLELEHRIRLHLLGLQEEMLTAELRVTSQRVNLFEKIKIPECRENIRRIRIALGDEQVAGVARGKLAKKRGEEEDVA